MASQVINLPGGGGISQLTGDVTAGPGTGSQPATLAITTTKGDLVVHSTSANARLGVGSNNQVLTADSAQTLGVKWAAASVTSPAGSNKAVQFNNNGVFGADSPTFFSYDLATHSLSVIGLGINLGRPPNAVLEVAGSASFLNELFIRFANPSASSALQLEYGVNPSTVIDAIKIYNTFDGPSSIGFWCVGSGTSNHQHAQILVEKSTLGADSSGNLSFLTSFNNVLSTKQQILADGRVAFNVANPAAKVHANGVDVTVENPATFNVTLTSAPPVDDVVSPAAFQVPGNLDAPTSQTATPNYSGSGFTADGSTYTYSFLSFDGNAWSAPVTMASFTDDNSSNPFSVDLTWSAPAQGVPTAYGIGRSINSGPIVWQYTPDTPTTWTDDNTGFTDSAPTSFYDDFVANGSTWNFSTIVGIQTSPSGATVYSPNPQTAGFTDSNDNTSFRIEVQNSSPSLVKWIPAFTSGSFVGMTGGGSFANLSTNSFTGDTTVTPTSYGIQSDGLALTKDFTLAEFSSFSGTNIYSATPLTNSTVDPNDGLFYYFVLDWTAGSAGTHDFKIVDATDAVALETSLLTINFDALSVWSDPTTITPTTLNLPGVVAQNNAGSLSDAAPMVVIGGTDYSRIDLFNASAARLASIESSTSLTTFRSTSGLARIQFSDVGVGFLAQSPAAAQTGGAATAGAVYTSTEQDMLQKAYDCLRTFGLLT